MTSLMINRHHAADCQPHHRHHVVHQQRSPPSSSQVKVKVELAGYHDDSAGGVIGIPARSSSSSSSPGAADDIKPPTSHHQLIDIVDLTTTSIADDDDDKLSARGADFEAFQTTRYLDQKTIFVRRPAAQQIGLAATPSGYGGGGGVNAGGVVSHHRLRPNCARTAEIIKAKYIRSAQQYEKICSLIELLAAQHNKLDGRRQQLQRTMSALSTMYRLNKIRSTSSSSGTAQSTTSAITPSSNTASGSSPKSSRRVVAMAEADFCRGSTTVNGFVVDDDDVIEQGEYSTLPEVIVGEDCEELEPEMLQAAEGLSSTARRWCDDDPTSNVSSAPRPLPPPSDGFQITERQQYTSCSPPSMSGSMWTTSYDDPRQRQRGLQSPLPAHAGSHAVIPSATAAAVVAAHSHCNRIGIDVADFERPMAAHTCKADLSSYSYMQLYNRQHRQHQFPAREDEMMT